jgi:sporulation protein YhbH
MSQKIDLDHGRFRQIIRGKIKQNLRKYISQGEMIARKGKDTVSIPIPSVDIPRFKHGDKQQGGVGQGEGEVGDSLGQGEEQPGSGQKAGDRPGEHLLDIEVSLQELAEIMGEELELPRIEPKGTEKIIAYKDKYSGIRTTGPESLRHFRRTFRQAIRRQIAMGTYDAKNPIIVPIREDKRYRSWRSEPLPQSNAVIIYMMDVSGSMGDEQKEIVRIESFWIDTWLRRHYQGLESHYIIHDAVAREVDRETFFHTRESGGTMISSAYKLASQMMDDHYSPDEWNIYPFHFSDGDNWSMDDTLTCMDILKKSILPRVNMFAYGQVESPYGSGQFIKDLREHFGKDDSVVTSEIRDKDGIVGSIKEFLGKGK